MNMKKRLLPLVVLMLLSTNAMALEYLGIFGNFLNFGPIINDGPVTSVGSVIFTPSDDVGTSAGISITATYTSQVYGTVNEPGDLSPHPSMMFGGQSNNTAKYLLEAKQLVSMSDVGTPNDSYYSPTPNSIGAGLDVGDTYAFEQYVSVEELLNLDLSTNASHLMGQLTYTFSEPVDDPILHVTGLGGFFSSGETFVSQVFSVDLELVPGPGAYVLDRLSGTSHTVLDGNTIKNDYDYDDFANTTGTSGTSADNAGSGSFEVTGKGITTVTFNVHMVGKMTVDDGSPGGAEVPSEWSTLDTEDLQKYTGDRFNTTWTLPFDRDYGDAPESYLTKKSNIGPSHRIVNGLYLGSTVDSETDVTVGATALQDDQTGTADEDGVTFTTNGDGGPDKFKVTAALNGTNTTGRDAMLCGWLDGAADSAINGVFNRSVTYASGAVGQSDPTVGAGNEELCIMVPQSGSTAVTLAGGSNPAQASCTGGTTSFNCTLSWNPNFSADVQSFVRFRLTTAQSFFNNNSPSPTGSTGYALDGEVEDYALNFTPTAVTIGKVDLRAVPVEEFLESLGAGRMDNAALLKLLRAWAPEVADALAGANRDEIMRALATYLDPDGDGQVAILHWDTLEERGTVGFYVERAVADSSWVLINDQMLPGMVFAPLGAEYKLVDPGAEGGRVYQYRLIEQESSGNTREYGPFEVELN